VLDRLSNSATTANSLILVLVEWAGIVAVVVLIIWLFRLRRRRQLVVSSFVNASGVPGLDAAAQGLGQLLRERLVGQLNITQRQLRENVRRTELSPTPAAADRSPMPVGEPDQRVKDLVTSLKAYVPQTAGPAVQVLGDVLLRPTGTRVTGTVQHGGAGRLGITLELTDLGGDHAPSVETIWDAATVGDKQGDPYGRLAKLLEPAARLAARRIVALELISAYSPRRRADGSRRSRHEHDALVHNFTGMLLQSDALVYADQGLAPFFFGQATKEFDGAVELAPELYQPVGARKSVVGLSCGFVGEVLRLR
jgi:hypothetical protein